MNELLKPLERINFRAEDEVWWTINDQLPADFDPEQILFVGDDGHCTIPILAERSYPHSHITIVDRSPETIEHLLPIAKQHPWTVINGDITEPDTARMILNETGGADLIINKHTVQLKPGRSQRYFIADMFHLARPDGFVGWSVPTFMVKLFTRPQHTFADAAIQSDRGHSTVFMGWNTEDKCEIARQLFEFKELYGGVS